MDEKNMQEILAKAEVLIEALPYIQRFNRKIIVVKYGGSAMVDEELKRHVIQDVTLLKLVGFKPIIVHGGGKEISRWVGKVGMEPVFVNGLRKTDEATMEIAEMKLIVDLIYQSGFEGMRYSISNTAEYGDYITGPKIITEDTKKAMKKILSDIQDGTFAEEFLLDMSPAGRQVHFKAMRKLASEHPSEQVGKEIRKLYSWNNEADKLINN